MEYGWEIHNRYTDSSGNTKCILTEWYHLPVLLLNDLLSQWVLWRSSACHWMNKGLESAAMQKIVPVIIIVSGIRLCTESGCRKCNEDTLREVRFSVSKKHWPVYIFLLWTQQKLTYSVVAAIVQLGIGVCVCVDKIWGGKAGKQQAWGEPVRDRRNKAFSTELELKRRRARVGEPKQRHSDSLISSGAPQTWTGHI